MWRDILLIHPAPSERNPRGFCWKVSTFTTHLNDPAKGWNPRKINHSFLEFYFLQGGYLVWISLPSMELRKSHRNRKRFESSSKGPVGEDMWVFLGGVRMYSPNIKTWSEKRYLGLLSEHILGISPRDNWFHRRLVAFQVKLSNLNQHQFIIASRGDHKVSSNSLPQKSHQRSLLILSVYPSPSNSHKWRKIGIPH